MDSMEFVVNDSVCYVIMIWAALYSRVRGQMEIKHFLAGATVRKRFNYKTSRDFVIEML